MKQLKTLMVAGLLMIPSAISAKSLSSDEAEQIAATFIRKRNTRVNGMHSPALNIPQLTLVTGNGKASRSSAPAYYIFNVSGDNGYVIVAGDDRFNEILGYADNGNYLTTQINPALEYWLDYMAEEMASADTNSSIVSRTAVEAPDIAPLLTTKWGQGAPYNNYCWASTSWRPTIGEKPKHAPTGCVATAMAQVINYHKWPVAYRSGDNVFEYKWDLTLPTYNGSEAEESIEQVAQLMKHCGQSVNMSYGVDESAASSLAILPALVKNFNYDGKTIQTLIRNTIGRERLHSLIYKELKEKRPVLVGGEYPDGGTGHEFILDGCNKDGFFHVNWGWDGYLDGYFRLTSLRPEDYGTVGNQKGYSFNLDITIGILPSKNTAITDELAYRITANGDLRYSTQDTIMVPINTDGMYFTTINGEYNGFSNTGGASFEGYQNVFQTKWTDTQTGDTVILGEDYFVKGIMPGRYTSDLYVKFKIDEIRYNGIKPNTIYDVSLVTVDKSTDPIIVRDVEYMVGRNSFIQAEFIGDSLRIIHPKTQASLKADLSAFPGKIVTKANQSFDIPFTNISNQEYLGEIKCRFRDESGETVPELTEYLMLDLLPGESITEKLIIDNLRNAAPGIYTASIYDFRDNLICEPKTVELYEYKLDISEANFPDPVFREYVTATYDSDRNGALSEKEIASVYNMQLNNMDISNLSGIENFYNLNRFEMTGGQLKKLDLSTNPSIYYIRISNAPLETVSTYKLQNLAYFGLSETSVKSLDLTPCHKIEQINLYNDSIIESLNISGLSNLRWFSCQKGNLQNLDLTGLENLEEIICTYNNLKELDVRNLDKLVTITAYGNSIQKFYHSNQQLIKRIDLDDNELEGKLDFTPFPALENLSVTDNKLTGIKLGNHPKLQYISLTNNTISGKLDLSKYEKINSIYMSGNMVSELILGNHPDLEVLVISHNQIPGSLNLSIYSKLKYIWASKNKLQGIKLGNNPALLEIDIANNDSIEGTLDISNSPKITDIRAYGNKISTFKYSNHPDLKYLYIYNNELTHFHAEDFPSLKSSNCFGQKPHIAIETPNLNLKSLWQTGFNPQRSMEWWAEWHDGEGYLKTKECQVINDVVLIPEEAGSTPRLSYKYITDLTTNDYYNFEMYVTRPEESGIDDIITDPSGHITVEGNTIIMDGDGLKEVFTTTGQCVYRGKGRSISLDNGHGIYLVRTYDKTYKVAI